MPEARSEQASRLGPQRDRLCPDSVVLGRLGAAGLTAHYPATESRCSRGPGITERSSPRRRVGQQKGLSESTSARVAEVVLLDDA